LTPTAPRCTVFAHKAYCRDLPRRAAFHFKVPSDIYLATRIVLTLKVDL